MHCMHTLLKSHPQMPINEKFFYSLLPNQNGPSNLRPDIIPDIEKFP